MVENQCYLCIIVVLLILALLLRGPQDSLKLHIIIFSMSGYYNANAWKVSLDGILLTLKNNAYRTTDTLNAHF